MIQEAIDALVLVQSGLTITDPIQADVTMAYDGFPNPNNELPGPRVWQNEWKMDLLDITRSMALREFMITVRMQFFAGNALDGNVAQTQRIANSFWQALVDALYPLHTDPVSVRLAQSLGGACTRTVLRGADPTVGILTRGGKSYIGCEGFLDVYFTDFWQDQ